MENVAAFNSLFEFFDQGAVDAYYSRFLSLADEMDLSEMQFNVFWFKSAQFRPSETSVDQASDDEAKFTVKEMVKCFQSGEEDLEFVRVEAPWNPVLRFREEFKFSRLVFFDISLADGDVQILSEDLEVVIDSSVCELSFPVSPEFFNKFLGDLPDGSFFKVVFNDVRPGEVSSVTTW
jgi:hypothetical protein